MFDLRKVEGIVTFPPFHTVLAILTAYACRDVRPLFVAAVLLNALVIVSTLPEGGHHLVDIMAGALIAGVTIIGVRRALAVGTARN
ncbi:phosphatase PAP2 family protein [Chelatococcus sp. SYSU_G07232]|uniref:Phosphatase PAP2 family protein n=1 Tax=Chelatococcus albus TaxID=3047466 RepID=A0ABT7AJD0_9HYPH|nr:phosphatase PAP2 family protein [Chelatococcus sp. SYSU_G07232]MDJ1159486.1 phosphatase PAP2 family protein [Chelatococcus sp. SYSU_G07232]